MKNVIILLLIINISALPVIADDIEWVDPQVRTLRFNEFISRDGYFIQATDFNSGSFLITVNTANKSFVTQNIIFNGESLNINNELNITVLDIQEKTGTIGSNRGLNVVVDSWAKIETRKAGKPFPKISVFSYQGKTNNRTKVSSSFRSNSEIRVDFLVKNDGKALLKNLTFKINTTLPIITDEKLYYDLYELKGGNESEIITVRFLAPHVEENKIFTIMAEVNGNDISGKAYRAIDHKNIEVVPFISNTGIINIRKYVSEKVFLGDFAVVSLNIENNGSKSIRNITLTDTLPFGLEPVNTELKWNLTLEPFEKKSISYQIRPKKPGNYFFLAGSPKIIYKDELFYNNKSSRLIVTGPYVVLTKSASSVDLVKGENVTITIVAKNMGDATAIVKYSDEIPSNYSLGESVYKSNVRTMILRPGKSVSFSYDLNIMMAGKFSLPPSRAKVSDQFLYGDERYTQRIVSNNLSMEVSEFSKPQLSKINITASTLKSARLELAPQDNGIALMTEKPVSGSDISKSAGGFQGYMLFIILFIMIFIIKRQDHER